MSVVVIYPMRMNLADAIMFRTDKDVGFPRENFG